MSGCELLGEKNARRATHGRFCKIDLVLTNISQSVPEPEAVSLPAYRNNISSSYREPGTPAMLFEDRKAHSNAHSRHMRLN